MYRLTREQINSVIENASDRLFWYCRDHGIHYLVVGSSGGLDSAVTLALAERACVKARNAGYRLCTVGLILPCHSNPDAERLGRLAIQRFGAEEAKIELTDDFDFLINKRENANQQIRAILEKTGDKVALADWEKNLRVAQGNIKARLRMMLGTYHVARMMNGLVLSTDNLSEYWMGFWTLHGDVGDYSMIQFLLKGLELYDIAAALNVPEEILKSIPDADLGVAPGGDAGQIGAEYRVWEPPFVRLIKAGFNPDGAKEQLAELPKVEGATDTVPLKQAERAIFNSFKRKGTVILTRADLGLPEIKDIEL